MKKQLQQIENDASDESNALNSQKHKTRIYQKLLGLTGTFLFIILSLVNVNAQITDGVVLKPMHILSESPQHVDVSGAIVRCDTANYVTLKVFNENSETLDISFRATIVNTTNGE